MQVILLDLGKEMRGGQRQVLYLARFLTEHPEYADEFSPIIACPASSPLRAEAEKSGVHVLPLRGRRFWNPCLVMQFRGFINKQIRRHRELGGTGPALLIHTNDAHAASLGAITAKGNDQIRLMHTRRVSYALHPGKRSAKYLQADLIAAVSAEIGDVLIQGGISKDKIRVIHSGIDPSLYLTRGDNEKQGTEPGNAVRDKKPAQGSSSINKTRFVIVGALTAQKGHEVLLRAMSLLKNTPPGPDIQPMPDFEVSVFGEGALGDDLRKLAVELGIEDLISFMGHRETKSELSNCDILLSPSVDGEGSSAAIKEGWAVGLPVIVSDLPSNLELVEAGKDGLVVKTGDPASLAQAMCNLALDQDLRSCLAQSGRKKLENFTSEAMAKSYVAVYRELSSHDGKKLA